MRYTYTALLCVLLFAFAHAHSSETHAPPPITRTALRAGVQIIPESTVLEKSGDWVSVSWSVSTPAMYNLTIAVFSPSKINFTAKAPIKWMYLSGTQGTANFQLTNFRTDYAFVLIENSAIISVSAPVTFTNPNEPLQAHIALSAQCKTCVNVMWVTRDTQNPTVKWGTQSGVYTNSTPAQTHTYVASDMCGEPATTYGWMDPGMFHEAVLELEPNVVYYYVAGDESLGWTEERTIKGPRVDDTSGTVAILAYGDMGKIEADSCDEHWPEPGSLATTSSLSQVVMDYSYDTILHIGDISYAVGYGAQWDTFFRLIEPFASRVPYMVCPGNHEFDFKGYNWLNGTDSGGECGVPYRNRFHMPLLGSPSTYYSNHTSNWYSFNMGPVHVIMMDTEETFDSLEQGQLNFIAEDLASVDRTATPFIIFNGHRPMYVTSTNAGSSYSSDQGMATLLRQYVEPLLYKYKVDLALWGHVHAYQRSCPVYNTTCVDDGTVHVIIGMAGAGFSNDVQFPSPDYIMYYDYINFGYANITVSPELLHLQFITTDGAINDNVYIKSKFL